MMEENSSMSNFMYLFEHTVCIVHAYIYSCISTFGIGEQYDHIGSGMHSNKILVQQIPPATSHHLDVCLVFIPIWFYCLDVNASLWIYEIAGMVHRSLSEALVTGFCILVCGPRPRWCFGLCAKHEPSISTSMPGPSSFTGVVVVKSRPGPWDLLKNSHPGRHLLKNSHPGRYLLKNSHPGRARVTILQLIQN